LASSSPTRRWPRQQAERGAYFQEIGRRILASVGKASTGGTLHGAINAYIAWLEAKFVTPPEAGQEQRTSQTGKKQAERAVRLKEHHKNIALSDFGGQEIDALIGYWANRPKTRKGGHYSFWTCKHQIRLIKHFIRWLHKNAEFAWKKPADYEFDRVPEASESAHMGHPDFRVRGKIIATISPNEGWGIVK
jgi:hypothetical protein